MKGQSSVRNAERQSLLLPMNGSAPAAHIIPGNSALSAAVQDRQPLRPESNARPADGRQTKEKLLRNSVLNAVSRLEHDIRQPVELFIDSVMQRGEYLLWDFLTKNTVMCAEIK